MIQEQFPQEQPPVEPAPSDVAVPEAPAAPAQPTGQLATPEQKQELLDMIAAIRQKIGGIDALKSAASDSTDNTRRELLQQVFEILQLAGVNLSDTGSVSDFLQQLRAQSPDLAAWFEEAMDALLGSTGLEGSRQEQEGEPQENEYENGNQTQGVPEGI